LGRLHRTTFVRQAAQLTRVKAALWRDLLHVIPYDPYLSLVDSFPVPVCRLAQAYRCGRFASQAAYGYDEMAKHLFYGFRAHLRICWPGVIETMDLAPANVHELAMLEELTEGAQGWLLGDRNYWSPPKAQQLAAQGLCLEAPFKFSSRDKTPWPRWLTQVRRLIETVAGQLVERFRAKRVWARDLWHLSCRWWRKILAHTFAVWFCCQLGLDSPLQFDKAIAL